MTWYSVSRFVLVLLCVADIYRSTSGSGCSNAHASADVVSDKNGDHSTHTGGTAGTHTAGGTACPCRTGINASHIDRMDVIKNDILRKLRMLQPPNTTAHGRRLPEIPPLREILETANIETAKRESRRDQEDDHVTTMSILALSQPVSAEMGSELSDVIQFKFNTSGVEADDLISAQLGVYVRDTSVSQSQYGRYHSSSATDSTYVQLSLVRRRRSADGNIFYQIIPKRKRSLSGQSRQGQGRWMQFEIKHIVREWLRYHSQSTQTDSSDDSREVETLGDAVLAMLRVEAKNDRNQETGVEVVLNPQHAIDLPLKPYIDIRVKESSAHRRRRRGVPSDLDCDDTSAETRCCRYPLTVDFTEFGWDWVLAPKRYEAFYCSGICPFTYYQVHTNTHLVHQSLPPAGTPCCAPRKMASLPLVYVDGNGGIVYGTLPGMIVERCGCA